MASEAIWTAVLSAAVPTGLALATIMLTRERSGGADHVKLTNCVKDVDTLKVTNVTHATTLASHTILHEHIDERVDKIEDQIRRLQQQQDQALGREQAATRKRAGI